MAGQLIVVFLVTIIGVGIVLFFIGVLIQSFVWIIKKCSR